MIRDTWFWEVEFVRLEDGEPAARPRRLDFSVRPLNYLLGGLVTAVAAAGLVVGLVLAYPDPGGRMAVGHGAYLVWGDPEPYYDAPHGFCGCGVRDSVAGTEGDVVTPLRSGNDSTMLVRRLP